MSAAQFIYTSINFKRCFFSTNNGNSSLLLHSLTPLHWITASNGVWRDLRLKEKRKMHFNTGRKGEGNLHWMGCQQVLGYSRGCVYLRKIWKILWMKYPAQRTRHLWYFWGLPRSDHHVISEVKNRFSTQAGREIPACTRIPRSRSSRLQFATAGPN